MHSHICLAEAKEGLLRAIAIRVIASESAKRDASQQRLNESAARINTALQQTYQRCAIRPGHTNPGRLRVLFVLRPPLILEFNRAFPYVALLWP